MISSEILKFITSRFNLASENDITEHIKLTDGRSEAEVYRIKIKSKRDDLNGSYILKISNKDSSNEAEKAKELADHAPDFSNHLVKVISEQRFGDKILLIYSYANNSVMNSVAFSKMDMDYISSRCEVISYDLLTKMNKNAVTEKISFKYFFSCLLSKQLENSERFADKVHRLIDIPEAQCVNFNGKIYPNPYYFIKCSIDLEESLSNFIFFKGINHGDLHGLNLILTEDTYALIDYDNIILDSPLFFDHAYLEFSIFYDNSKNNDLISWEKMLDHLIAPAVFKEVSHCANYIEFLIRNGICSGIKKWMEERNLEKMEDDIEIQFIMARIAAGINFFCKRSCSDTGRQIKVLFYVSYCLKLFLDKINFTYNSNILSNLLTASDSHCDSELWSTFLKYTNYTKILITDDDYTAEQSENLKYICMGDWSLIVDIGSEQNDTVIYKTFLGNCKTRSVKKINIIAKEKTESFNSTLNVLSVRKPSENSYNSLWRNNQLMLTSILKDYLDQNQRIPIVFVFDCCNDARPFQNHLINWLCDRNIPACTRFVAIKSGFSSELKEESHELEKSRKWYFVEYNGLDLISISNTYQMYLDQSQSKNRSVYLPSVTKEAEITESDLTDYGSSVELIYDDLTQPYSFNIQQGFDMSSTGCSFGENFYKGNEASWNDIAYRYDLPLISSGEYKKICEKITSLAEESSHRVTIVNLLHLAGSGGTTLSKRILWDLRYSFPCARLKKYNDKTAKILLEIYQKTGKCVILSVETGSTIITEDELYRLKNEVYAQNGKMVIISIARDDFSYDNTKNDKNEGKCILFKLGENNMRQSIADKFLETFSEYAKRRSNSTQRIEELKKITLNPEQRSPFFYGFYAFQEEYNLVDRLKRTMEESSSKDKVLLNYLSLITVFSQNVCLSFSELYTLLEISDRENNWNYYALWENLPKSFSQLVVIRENGLRLCHKVIAEKILLMLHTDEAKQEQIGIAVFESAKQYITTLSEIYGSENEYVDKILKELIIDRAYIDSEQRKTRFSNLVEKISLWTDKKHLFEFLIEKFPENPHYYNHLARLLAFGDKNNTISPNYKEAIEMAKMAINKAQNAKSVHRTTLGCIYGQWILRDIDEEIGNKRNGRLSSNIGSVIVDIQNRYLLATEEFEEARKNSDEFDNVSYCYFPQINMECKIIAGLTKLGGKTTVTQLLEIDPDFKDWYEEHFSIAMALLSKMRNRLGDADRFVSEAKNSFKFIVPDHDKLINDMLIASLDSDSPSGRKHRRCLTSYIFSKNNFNWNIEDKQTLCLAEQCLKKNITTPCFNEKDEYHKSFDTETWFELYRRTDYFDAHEAQTVIADCMPDGYKKSYLLFLVTFIMRYNGIASVTTASIIQTISQTNKIARSCGLNTAREYDAYVNVNNKNNVCPIVSVSELERNKNHEPENLEDFTGIITEVEQTYGKIQLDKFNLDVTFTPRPTSLRATMFTRDDINCKVKLNLMFSYSGLRGWNVVKLN